MDIADVFAEGAPRHGRVVKLWVRVAGIDRAWKVARFHPDSEAARLIRGGVSWGVLADFLDESPERLGCVAAGHRPAVVAAMRGRGTEQVHRTY